MHTSKNQNHLTECDIIFQNRKKHVFCKHYILILHFKQSFTFVHMIGTIFFLLFLSYVYVYTYIVIFITSNWGRVLRTYSFTRCNWLNSWMSLKKFIIPTLTLFSTPSSWKGMVEVNTSSFYYVNNNTCLLLVSMFKRIFKRCPYGTQISFSISVGSFVSMLCYKRASIVCETKKKTHDKKPISMSMHPCISHFDIYIFNCH